MPFKFRIIPLTILAACFMLVVKVAHIMDGGERYRESLFISDLQAADALAQEEEEEEETETPEETGKEEEEDAAEGEDAEKLPEEATGEPKREFSQIEIDILQSLAERREELEARARELELRANVLEATEARIDQKLNELKTLKEEVSGLLDQKDQEQNASIRSLVKIYENMKPKPAALIFEEMEMPIMVQVIDKMKEKQAAKIMSYMNPQKARELTVRLAEMKKLRSSN